MEQSVSIAFQIIVLMFSVVIHEVAHGVVAEELGDDTARRAGRITLNPLKHIDPFGSVILPLLLSLVPGGVVLGWAKPVPFNPFKTKNPKSSSALIALAGPASNLVLALVFAVAIRVILGFGIFYLFPVLIFLKFIVVINIVLAIFNLIPLSPLDGSKILFFFLPPRAAKLGFVLERYGYIILLAFIFFGINLLYPAIEWVYRVMVGG